MNNPNRVGGIDLLSAPDVTGGNTVADPTDVPKGLGSAIFLLLERRTQREKLAKAIPVGRAAVKATGVVIQ